MDLYVDKTEMYNEIVKFKKTGKISENLHMMVWKICKNISRTHYWSSKQLSFIEDMVNESYIDIIKRLHKFDEKKFKNPHGYFSSFVFNNFYDFNKEEIRQKKIRHRLKKREINRLLIDEGIVVNQENDYNKENYCE